MSAADAAAVAAAAAASVLPDVFVLDAIAEMLSGARWDAEDLDLIADLVRASGRTIADYNPSEVA